MENSGGMRVVAEADNGVDALRKIREITCDVVLLDISMSGMSGIDVLKQIRVTNTKLSLPILSN